MARRIPQNRLPELIDCATGVFISQGYRRTQMADVAKAMGVAKGTVYLYVESKEALFDLAARHADSREPPKLPSELPIPTPRPGATLRRVRERLAREAALPALTAALARRRVVDVRAELEAILRELYGVLARNRTGLKLVDRCARDHPELAAVWFQDGREAALGALTRYLESRIRRGRLRPVPDTAVAARVIIETLSFWAVHRHWDPSPQTVDNQAAEDTVVKLLLAALTKEPPA
jgi:AcrR family transcriptional regulator